MATITQRIAPTGWHLLKKSEVMAIIDTLEGELDPEGNGYTCGGKMKEIDFTHWNYPNTGATNESGFGGVGGGERMGLGAGSVYVRDISGEYFRLKEINRFWIINDLDGNIIESCSLNFSSGNIIFDDLSYSTGGASSGLSVRLVSDTPETYEPGDTFTDLNGNIYPLVKIGDVVIIAENLRTTKYANGDDIPVITDADAWAADEDGAMCWYNNDPTNGYTNTAQTVEYIYENPNCRYQLIAGKPSMVTTDNGLVKIQDITLDDNQEDGYHIVFNPMDFDSKELKQLIEGRINFKSLHCTTADRTPKMILFGGNDPDEAINNLKAGNGIIQTLSFSSLSNPESYYTNARIFRQSTGFKYAIILFSMPSNSAKDYFSNVEVVAEERYNKRLR